MENPEQYKVEEKTYITRVEYKQWKDRGSMANVDDLVFASPIQGLMNEIHEKKKTYFQEQEDCIREIIIEVGIDPDALQKTGELNARLQEELRAEREKVEKLTIELQAMRGAANSYKQQMEKEEGTWKVEMTGNGWNCWGILTCSVCGATIEDENIQIALNYCPKCGARMRNAERSPEGD